HQRGDFRHRKDRRREDRSADCPDLRPAPGRDHQRPGSAQTDLPEDGGLRALRARRR
ncbi:MAG: hypothetical protein FD188_3240, partial [Ignavibacteria bacterium]